MKKNTDHIIQDNSGKTDPVGIWKCLHCGDSYLMNLPAPFDVIAAAQKAYMRLHRDCKKNPDPMDDPLGLEIKTEVVLDEKAKHGISVAERRNGAIISDPLH